jgi:hypothetical protein
MRGARRGLLRRGCAGLPSLLTSYGVADRGGEGKKKEILLVEDWPQTRRVVKVLTEERGFTVEEVAEEIERRGFFRGEALAALKGEADSNNVCLPLLADILDLSREEVYSVMDATMADVAAAYGYLPPPKHGRPSL